MLKCNNAVYLRSSSVYTVRLCYPTDLLLATLTGKMAARGHPIILRVQTQQDKLQRCMSKTNKHS